MLVCYLNFLQFSFSCFSRASVPHERTANVLTVCVTQKVKLTFDFNPQTKEIKVHCFFNMISSSPNKFLYKVYSYNYKINASVSSFHAFFCLYTKHCLQKIMYNGYFLFKEAYLQPILYVIQQLQIPVCKQLSRCGKSYGNIQQINLHKCEI